MFMNRREHLLNMKNKYLTKCLCITMAAAISFTGTASVFASEETACQKQKQLPGKRQQSRFHQSRHRQRRFRTSGDNVRAGTGTSRVCTDAIRAHRNTTEPTQIPSEPTTPDHIPTETPAPSETPRSYTYSDTGSKCDARSYT